MCRKKTQYNGTYPKPLEICIVLCTIYSKCVVCVKYKELLTTTTKEKQQIIELTTSKTKLYSNKIIKQYTNLMKKKKNCGIL